MTALPLRPPLIVHHMAALDGGHFPPNSLEGVRASLEGGADFIEVDVTALADEDYLLVHDPVLESETTGSGPVAHCTARQARELRCKVNGAATDFRVPTLGEIVALLAEHPARTRLQLDFKNVIPFADDEPLIRLARLIEPLGERVIVSSEADWQLRRLRRLAPWLELGFDIHFYIGWPDPAHPRNPAELPHEVGAYGYYDDHPLASRRVWPAADYLADRCAALMTLLPGASTLYINQHFLVQSLEDGFDWAAALHEAGLKCDAWTLDYGDPVAEANARRLLAAGVDQFTTNTPLALRALLSAPSRGRTLSRSLP
ncbi:MAG: hypothetical protein KBH93_08970, partial [Anaerolineae bacterium]|nr:hypothetical protein [Anaerolineae bacterium]